MSKKIIYLTDLYYRTYSRNYPNEDLLITEELSKSFNLTLCNPRNIEYFEDDADLIVLRNTGSTILYKNQYEAFKERVKNKNLPIFNEFCGKGDMMGKQYLIDLTSLDYPVIPTIDKKSDLSLLPIYEDRYVVKPKNGADSIGLEYLNHKQISERSFINSNLIIQPAINFLYEVSFYFINNKFEYALYAPNRNKRWDLKKYPASVEDIAFAQKFIDWNSIQHGIQRIDACRTRNGRLLLMELEDLNPFLSYECLDKETQKTFISDFSEAINEIL